MQILRKFAAFAWTQAIVLATTRTTFGFTDMDVRNNLMNRTLASYNVQVPPTDVHNLPVIVEIGFGINHILHVNENDQSVVTNGWINAFWTDKRLAWDTHIHNVSKVFYFQKNIWVPDLSITNTLQKRGEMGYDDLFCVVTPDGRVSWQPGDLFSTICLLDITTFPFDTQVCTISITLWTLPRDVIKLKPITRRDTENTLYLSRFASNSLWQTKNITIKTANEDFYVSNGIDITIGLKRRPSFYVMSIVIPVFCIASLIPLVFALPVEKDSRVSFAVSVLLSFVVFLTLLGEILPETSTQTSVLTVCVSILLLTSSLSVFIAVITLRTNNSGSWKRMPWCKYRHRSRMDRSKCIVSSDGVDVPGDQQENVLGKNVPENSDLDKVLVKIFSFVTFSTMTLYLVIVFILTSITNTSSC